MRERIIARVLALLAQVAHLEQQALAQIARADAGRVAALKPLDALRDQAAGNAQHGAGFVHVNLEPAALVQAVHQVLGDQDFLRGLGGGAQVQQKLLGQGRLGAGQHQGVELRRRRPRRRYCPNSFSARAACRSSSAVSSPRAARTARLSAREGPASPSSRRRSEGQIGEWMRVAAERAVGAGADPAAGAQAAAALARCPAHRSGCPERGFPAAPAR